MKDYNNLKYSDYKREKIFKLKSSLCLMLVLDVAVESESCFSLTG